MKAQEILENDETAVVIFTDGLNLNISADGMSASGVWRIDKNLSVDKVIIYLRNKSKKVNEIYIGDFVELTPSQVKGYENRLAVEFNNAVCAGETDENWNGFTSTKRGAVSPVKYIR